MSTRRTGPLPPAIGSYTVAEKLGSGGTATVYRARHPDGHEVAIKVLSLHLADNPNVRKRFEREAHALQQLKHPHILPVEDFGENDGRLYLVMKMMGTRSLDDLIKKGPLLVDDLARYIRQIASALDFAHSKGIIHRDVKPDNILLDDQNRPFLADFGVAYFVATEKGERLTTAGEFVGTPSYASPEQCRGEVEKIGRPSDIYSLAVMAFEMATGRLPFVAPSPLAVIKMHLFTPPPNPLEFNRRLPKDLYGVLIKGMAKLPEGRYPSAMKFSEALDEAIGVHVLSQVDDSDDWLHADTTPVSPDRSEPAPESQPESRAEPRPEPRPAAVPPFAVFEAASSFRPEGDFSSAPVNPFDGIGLDQVVSSPAESDFDDHFEIGTDFDEEMQELPDEFPASESVLNPPGAVPPAPDAVPIIRPIGPVPLSRPRRRVPWMQIGIYTTILISVAAIMLGAIIVYTRVFLPSVELNATTRSALVGVTVKYPSEWFTASDTLAILSDQAVPALVFSDRPVPPRGPYNAAGLVIVVQRIDPVDVFHVPPGCQGLLFAGPQQTFDCMKQRKFVTPGFAKFNTSHYEGVKLPGTLPPQRASLPVILLSTHSPRWIAISIVQWNGYDGARDVWERMAKSLHLG